MQRSFSLIEKNCFGLLRNGSRTYSKYFNINREPLRNLLAVQSQIIDSQQTFFEVNLGHIVKQFQRIRKLLPRVRPYYAVKCQPDPKVLELLASLGAGFDCASREEMQLAIDSCQKVYEEFQIDKEIAKQHVADNIIFANPFKFKQDMLFAEAYGIEKTTFDSEGELQRLKRYWPSAKVLIRVSTKKKYSAKCQLGDKFGVTSHNIEKMLKKAKELNFDVAGVSFHVGNMCDDFSAWPDTVEYCSEIMKMITAFDYDPTILDIGGGYPGLSSVITDSEIELQEKFERMCVSLNSALDTYYSNKFTIISEPGTFFVHGAYTLATEIIGKRKLEESEYSHEFYIDRTISSKDRIVKIGSLDAVMFEDPSNLHSIQLLDAPVDDSNRYIYILDDGVYGSFNILQFMEFKFLVIGILNPNASLKNFVTVEKSFVTKLYGPTCDTLDCISPESNLPELDVGDWLVWVDMGAYTNASRSDFNGITKPKSYYYISNEDQEIIDSIKKKLFTLNVKGRHKTI